jgi:hypothetical protein
MAAAADETARLYGLPLDEFTAERDAVAKRLRADGEREEADRIKKLRKPSVPAWAVNQAARADAKAAKALVKAGEKLAAAQEATLSGKRSPDLRKAVAAHGETVERMMGPVVDALGKAASAANVDRARETLRAVASDDELRGEFQAASVVRDREPVGLGGAAPAVLKPAPARKRGASGSRKRAQDRLRKAQRAMDGAAAEVEDAERRVGRAERDLEQASRARDAAVSDQEAREADLEQARAEVEQLDAD